MVHVCFAETIIDPKWANDWKTIDPYTRHVQQTLQQTKSADSETRCVAYQNLGLLRSCATADTLAKGMSDASPRLRSAAAASLGLCGNKSHVDTLLRALNDQDFWVRQATSVALENMTGKTALFNASATPGTPAAKIDSWTRIVDDIHQNRADYSCVTNTAAPFWDRERAARALGAVGNLQEAIPLLRTALFHYETKKQAEWVDAETLFVQAAIRSLGRLGGSEAEDTLIRLLAVKEWSCYAAEALGDCGTSKAVDALIGAFPKHALRRYFPDNDWFIYTTNDIPCLPKMDTPHFPAVDRMPRAAHAMLTSIARLSWTPEQRQRISSITPQIQLGIPNDHDASVVYNPEPIQELAAYIFEKAGVRQQAVEALFDAFDQPVKPVVRDDLFVLFKSNGCVNARTLLVRKPVYGISQLLALSRDIEDAPRFEALLAHTNGWVKMTAAKALLFLDAKTSAPALRKALQEAPPDSSFGFCGVFDYRNPRQGQDEFNDPTPRWKEPFLIALSYLGTQDDIPLLTRYAQDKEQVSEIQCAAIQALANRPEHDVTTPLLVKIAQSHPLHIACMLAREALWARGASQPNNRPASASAATAEALPEIKSTADALAVPLIFIKGDLKPTNIFQIPSSRTSYTTTDSGPVYRTGRTICRLESQRPDAPLRELFNAGNGYVADIEISYDGSHILFSRRGGDNDPWWHICEMNADGTDIRQLTQGYYHDVNPNYMPDGRIIFSSSRTGLRDEYHGYLAVGLATMNADGTDIRVIGMNFGGDAEPIIAQDGRILFTRLEVIYSRMKTEWNLLSVLPDGTQPLTLYGPESRDFWRAHYLAVAAAPPRHRVLAFSQPQQLPDGRILLNSFDGPFTIGPRKQDQQLLFLDPKFAITTPYPVDNKTLFVAAGERPKTKDKKGRAIYDKAAPVDHGLYYLDIAEQKLKLIYNDPKTADFEARPLISRKRPPVIPPQTVEGNPFVARLDCQSVFRSRNPLVRERARYVRVAEGLPIVTRYQTQYSGGIAWKQHGGAVARILGTAPLAPDGSFSIEVPADRLIHVQALDSNWHTMDDQLIWMHVRPGENRGCLGCHEEPDVSPQATGSYMQAASQPPISCLPHPDNFRYRGKIWFKGSVRRHDEERMRTANSTTLLGRE
ncbi:MAG: HEAT repeat domain-containing protein [bacterium]